MFSFSLFPFLFGATNSVFIFFGFNSPHIFYFRSLLSLFWSLYTLLFIDVVISFLFWINFFLQRKFTFFFLHQQEMEENTNNHQYPIRNNSNTNNYHLLFLISDNIIQLNVENETDITECHTPSNCFVIAPNFCFASSLDKRAMVHWFEAWALVNISINSVTSHLYSSYHFEMGFSLCAFTIPMQ